MRSSSGDWSRCEQQTTINLASDEEEFKLPLGNANVDVEIGNIRDTFPFLFHSTENHSNRSSPTIQMIPIRIRDLNPKVFDPRQVSIGPLHRKNVNLQAFEEKKETFLNDLLSKSSLSREQILETCIRKVNASLSKIKACYGDGIKDYSDDEITRMMVMDGCFILEYLYKNIMRLFRKTMVIEPISMAFDLVLIENQIPFFVLQDIFQCTSPRFKPKVSSLNELIILGLVPALAFFESKFEIKNKEVFGIAHKHILGFIYECGRPFHDDPLSSDSETYYSDFEMNQPEDSETYYSDVEMNQPEDSETYYSAHELSDLEDHVVINGPSVSGTFYTAVELDRAGVNFKPHRRRQDLEWSMHIKLEFPLCSWCRPTLRMPVLRIHNYTELVFRNLIAYEQLSPCGVPHYVTSYAIAMDLLIDNHEDVAILVKSKVLSNTIGSNEEAAKLINDMRKEICCPNFFYDEQWEKMNRYHNRFWPRNIAWLRRTYFSNPWSIVALFAGILLFLFTMMQTYFTINPV